MEEKELMRRLENIKVPEIEIRSHRNSLRRILLNSDYFKEKNFFQVFRKSLVFSVPVLAFLLLLGINVVEPKLAEANALRVAMNNPEIKKMIEESDMVLSEVKLSGEKAYVLLNPKEETAVLEEKNPSIKIKKLDNEEVEGAIIEVNLQQGEVTKVNPIEWEEVVPLADNEKEEIQEIVKENEILKDIIPEGAVIEKINSSLPQKIGLVTEDDEAKVVPRSDTEKKANVHYTLDGKKWVVKVNLDGHKVEEIKYLLENQDSKGRNNQ